MASLKSVAKKAGVTPQAVRKWLDRNELTHEVWDYSTGGYRIPPEVEQQVIQYYQDKQKKKEDNQKSGTTVNQLGELLDYLKQENEYLKGELEYQKRVNHELTMSILDVQKVLGEVSLMLEAPKNEDLSRFKGLDSEKGTETPVEVKPGLRARLKGVWNGLRG